MEVALDSIGILRGCALPLANLEVISWMIGLQLGFGLVLATLAAWQLRPIFRRQDGVGGSRREPGRDQCWSRGAALNSVDVLPWLTALCSGKSDTPGAHAGLLAS